MSQPPTVILAPRVTADSVRIWEAAAQMKWPVRRLVSWRVPEGMADAQTGFVIYAEPLFAEAVSDQLGLILLEPPPEWLIKLPERFTKRRITLRSLHDARTIDQPAFIKPAEGKVFEARVYDHGRDLPGEDAVEGSLKVLCSDPVNFQLEVRSFIRDREIFSLSPYWRGGALAQDASGDWPFLAEEEAQASGFIREILSSSDVNLPPAFVLDVGFIPEQGWAVIEGNPCWGAGLYGCSAPSALHVCEAAIRRKSAMSDVDWQWTSPRVRRP